MHNYLNSIGYPMYILQPYSGLLVTKTNDGRQSINYYRFDTTSDNHDIILNLDILQEIDIKNGHTLMLLAMPLGRCIQNLILRNEFTINMGFYSNIANYLQHFIDNYHVYLTDIKLDNMVLHDNQIKFIDMDFVCKVRDNINALNVPNMAKEYYNTLPDIENTRERYPNKWHFHAPEFKYIYINPTPTKTLAWNIGWMLYVDLFIVYKECNQYRENSKIFRLMYDLYFAKNINILCNIKMAIDCADDVDMLRLITKKQILLKKIIPVPDPDSWLWQHSTFDPITYHGWNPENRMSLNDISEFCIDNTD